MKKPSYLFDYHGVNRRKFIINSLRSAGGLALLGFKSPLSIVDASPVVKQFTVQEIINIILKEGGLSTIKDTVDTIKSGHADQGVTGIVTTMFPTVAVIEETAKRNANFIIAHEPSFYNHRDDADWVKENATTKKKKQLLEKHNIAIWRFHDYCHSLKPDAVSYGIAKKLDWLPYYQSDQSIMEIPSLSLHQLVQHLKSSLGISNLRVIGNLDQQCKTIAFLPGAYGGRSQVSIVEAENPDVLIVGELSEWETAEYIRDARLLGGKTSLIVLGHAVSEEPGMEWLVEWLQPKFPEIKISHIASGDPFTWL